MLKSWQLCIVAISGIAALTGLEGAALALGHDGTILAVVMALIAGIVAGVGGFQIGKWRRQ